MQRTESRRLVLSGARLEPEIGFARAVQVDLSSGSEHDARGERSVSARH
jgi:hypothetical protein